MAEQLVVVVVQQIVRTVVDDLYRARPEVAPALFPTFSLLFYDCFIQVGVSCSSFFQDFFFLL